MYEFTKKEIREKFKKTKYGKKVNKMFSVALIFTGIFCFIWGFTHGYIHGAELELTKTQEYLLTALNYTTLIFVVIGVYFDGKRDGAIEQFKKNLKN